MNESYRIWHRELFQEFNRYMLEHPEFAEQIPQGAMIVLLDSKNPAFSQHSLEIAQKHREFDDEPERPTVYVKVGELKPVQSRLKNPRMLPRAPSYAQAA